MTNGPHRPRPSGPCDQTTPDYDGTAARTLTAFSSWPGRSLRRPGQGASMPDAPTPAECTEVRRHDRQVTDETWVRDFLRHAPAGTLATVAGGQPFVNMNIFVYSEPDHAL